MNLTMSCASAHHDLCRDSLADPCECWCHTDAERDRAEDDRANDPDSDRWGRQL
jgi:hypothetical protein